MTLNFWLKFKLRCNTFNAHILPLTASHFTIFTLLKRVETLTNYYDQIFLTQVLLQTNNFCEHFFVSESTSCKNTRLRNDSAIRNNQSKACRSSARKVQLSHWILLLKSSLAGYECSTIFLQHSTKVNLFR